jgi:hypothetical protein
MLYGEEKAREIVKPHSRSRRGGKRFAKSHQHRRERRAVRQELKQLRLEDDFIENEIDYLFRDVSEKSYWWSDHHFGHFVHWAIKKSKHLPLEERKGYILSLLPDTDLVTHAMRWLDWEEEFNQDVHSYRWYYSNSTKTKISREEAEDYLNEILEDSKLHRILNKFIKTAHKNVVWGIRMELPPNIIEPHVPPKYETEHIRKDKGPRVLRGKHDIRGFLNSVNMASRGPAYVKKPDDRYEDVSSYYYRPHGQLKNPKYHPEWKKALVYFLEIWLEYKDEYGKYNDHVLLLEKYGWNSNKRVAKS